MLYELTDLAIVKEAVALCKKTIESVTGFEVLVNIVPLGSPNSHTEEYLQELVCIYFGVNWQQLCGPRGSVHFSNARHAYCFLSRHYFGKSLEDIGSTVGNRDHATVINSIKAVKKWFSTNSPLCMIINNIKQKMEA